MNIFPRTEPPRVSDSRRTNTGIYLPCETRANQVSPLELEFVLQHFNILGLLSGEWNMSGGLCPGSGICPGQYHATPW